ncbi:LuxR C-terminal-related transcriptional regulator [Pandoraea horticolens]|nr:LuxR C-terminal-related transcriptional regulator [Pandoraea horticolens]
MLDIAARETKSPAIQRSPFVDSRGNVQMDEITKFPIFGFNGKVLGIVTYRHDITRTIPPVRVYQIHRYFHPIAEAIKRSLVFFGADTDFLFLPTEAQIYVFLLRSERYSNKEIARFMGISDRTVECHCATLRNKIVDGDLAHVIHILKRKMSCDENSIQS